MAEDLVSRRPSAPFSMTGVVGQSREWATALPTPGGLNTVNMNQALLNQTSGNARLAAIERSLMESKAEVGDHRANLQRASSTDRLKQAQEFERGDTLNTLARGSATVINFAQAAMDAASSAAEGMDDGAGKGRLKKISSFLDKIPGVGAGRETETTKKMMDSFLGALKAHSDELTEDLEELAGSISNLNSDDVVADDLSGLYDDIADAMDLDPYFDM